MKTKIIRTGKSALSIVLTVMMIVTTMLIGAISVDAADNAGTTIYFDNSATNWSAVYFYGWNNSADDGNHIMTQIEGTNYWSYTFATNYSGQFLFRNRGDDNFNTPKEQTINTSYDGTKNLAVAALNGENKVNVTWEVYNPGGTGGGTDTRTVYFKNTLGWSNVYAYVYQTDTDPWDSNHNENGDQKGLSPKKATTSNIPMLKVDGTDDIYSCTFTNSGDVFIAFNRDSSHAGYDNFYEEDVAYNRIMFSDSTPLYVPESSYTTYNTKANYYSGTWSAYPEGGDAYTATIKSNIKVTATPSDGDPVVLNETGDSATVQQTTVSASTLKLTAVGADYNFAGWVLGEGASITSGGSVTDPTITVKLTSNATIEATSITLSPRLSVNSDEVKIRTATVEENETFTLNAITKVGDKNKAAVKYTVDYYQYTTDIKSATKIGTATVPSEGVIDYTKVTDPDPTSGNYLIGHGNHYDASITHSIATAGTYKFYAIIKGLDSNGNVVTGNYENVSLSSSFMKDEVTVTVTKPFNKAEAYNSGLWVDVQPNETTLAKKSIALIKWTNKTGSSGGTLSNNNYILYIPGGVSLTLPVYSKFSKLTINGETVDNGKTFTFEDKKSYTVKGDGATYTLTVYQSNSDAIYTTTTTTDAKAKDGNNLPTKAYGAEIDKTIYTGQFMTSTGKDGAICNTLMDINEIKGRGNSSWEASGKFYGKYAYNIKLADKILPLNMDKNYATKAKSWCLLANNMDETGLRNVTVFEAAKRAGLSNVPEYKVADLYNNGEYLGSYLITEKVGVGKSKLISGTTVEDDHSDYDSASEATSTEPNGSYRATNGRTYSYHVSNTTDVGVEIYSKRSYLLEFDLQARATDEISWFKTPEGQYITVKAPEKLNSAEMNFILEKWSVAEQAVYSNDYSAAAACMDLDSFADVYLIQEFTKNLDSGATSYYVYWDGTKANPKWQATPIWDYDWALGGHTCEKPIVTSGASDYNNTMDNATGWFTKYKCLTRADDDYDSNVLNFQAQLANNSDFWNTNVVNAWNSDIYDSIMSVYSDDGYIKTAYDANLASYNMNETRYGFITADLIVKGSANDWGSKDTGDNLADCYKYLKNWAVTRANWMSEKLTETVSVSLDASVDNDTNTITLTPSVTRSKSSTYPLTYKYYQSKDNGAYELIYETTDATYTTAKLSTGSYTYKVEATYSTYTKATSDATSAISIQGNEPVLGSVTVEAPSTAITGETFTVTVTPTITSGDASTSQITYKLYTSDDELVATKTVTGKTAAVLTATAPTVETPTKYTYYVTATLGETTVPSANFTISVNKQQGSHDVTIYFKAPSTSVYTPYVSLNGGTAVALEKDKTKNLGTIYSGALSIYWWKTTLNIDSTNTNTLKFTTKGTQANGSISDKFNGSEYYFAIDNLVSGTELVNLTGKDEYIQNFYLTPLHMASPDINNATDTNLGFTAIYNADTGKYDRYRMGAKVDENGVQSVSIDSATSAQKYIASLTPLSKLQSQLYDVNLDGEVNIDDATLIQKSLVG